MTDEQVELGARALFDLESSTPLGRYALGPLFDLLSPVERDRFRAQARAVLLAALPPGDASAPAGRRTSATR